METHTAHMPVGENHRRYVVEVCFQPNVWSKIMTTDNYERAANTCNFWDERVDSRMIDTGAPVDALTRAMRRFDAVVARLNRQMEK